ncbi:SCAF11 [Branchiostoma lanceolatum]|uniref:SCAF11 protein n=1 Tax=Branchiostoma lanceolatum TaxID=7740 RepID=A0A8J9ZK74_BRALA|nr:SCAF11 [Branchiostoma lanceolatum]
MRQKQGTARGTHPTSSRPPKSSGPHHGKHGNKRTVVTHRGTARPAERKTARKAGRGIANKGGTAKSGGRKSIAKQANKGTAPPSVATTQPKGKKRTANQAFSDADRQARAKATEAKKGSKKPTTVETAKKQVERPTTAGTTKKQKIAAEPDCCPICLSELTTQQLAHPDVCRHVFCLQCLQTWQQRKNTCPIDNKEFQTLQLCSQDGKDIMPVVKNKNNGVVPVGIPPYNPLPPAQNRGEIRNPRDRHDEQSGYNSPGDWGYDGGLEDSSESWDDDQMGIRIEIRDGSEREGYDDQRDSVSDWSELNMDHHDDSGERNQRDESWDDDTGTTKELKAGMTGKEVGMTGKEVGMTGKEIGMMDMKVGMIGKEVGIMKSRIFQRLIGTEQMIGTLHILMPLHMLMIGALHQHIGALIGPMNRDIWAMHKRTGPVATSTGPLNMHRSGMVITMGMATTNRGIGGAIQVLVVLMIAKFDEE